jgi:hypothetical protein
MISRRCGLVDVGTGAYAEGLEVDDVDDAFPRPMGFDRPADARGHRLQRAATRDATEGDARRSSGGSDPVDARGVGSTCGGARRCSGPASCPGDDARRDASSLVGPGGQRGSEKRGRACGSGGRRSSALGRRGQRAAPGDGRGDPDAPRRRRSGASWKWRERDERDGAADVQGVARAGRRERDHRAGGTGAREGPHSARLSEPVPERSGAASVGAGGVAQPDSGPGGHWRQRHRLAALCSPLPPTASDGAGFCLPTVGLASRLPGGGD